MSVRLVTTPWLTKNLAGGGLDNPASPRWAEGDGRHGWYRTRGRATTPNPPARRSRAARAGRVSSSPCCSPSTSATRTSRSASSGPAPCIATRRAATDPRATTDEIELVLDGLLRLDGIALADLDAIAVASVVPAVSGRGRVDRRPARRAAADRRGRDGPARRPGRPAGRCRCRSAGQRPGRRPAVRHAGRRRRPRHRDDASTAWPPTARTSVARSPRAGARSRGAGRPDREAAPGRAARRRTGRSGGTRSAPSRPARSSATRVSSAACWLASGASSPTRTA